MIFYDGFKGFGSVIAFYCISTKHVHITKLFFCSIATNFDVSVTKTENVEYAELRYFFHFSIYIFFQTLLSYLKRDYICTLREKVSFYGILIALTTLRLRVETTVVYFVVKECKLTFKWAGR